MSRRTRASLLALLLGLGAGGGALAQHDHGAHAASGSCTPEHADMGHCTLPAAGAAPAACTPEHAAMGHCTPVAEPAQDDCPPAHAAMGHCRPKPRHRQPREPIPPLTDADRAAAFPALAHEGMAHGAARYGRVTLHRLEAWHGDHASGQAWEGSASIGGDIHRLWLRSSGERASGRTTSARAELHWSRAVARWWDVVAGVRHDFNPGSSRTRAAFGVQGIAPYMFEVSALAYVGEGGGATVKLEAEYDMRFTNRLVLQPLVEVELNSKDDPEHGSGLSNAEAGLRLRYEITRRFAPYLGIAHERSFGRSARHHEDAGEPTRDTRLVAGVRIWF